MAKIRVEWVVLGAAGYVAPTIIDEVVGTPVALTVTSTVTVAGSRPVAPDVPALPAGRTQRGGLYARVSAIEGNIIVAVGADPTAAQNNGLLILAGRPEVFPIVTGQKLSFIELA